MPSYVYTYVLFHLFLNTSGSSRLTTILITRLITIRYTYHSQYDNLKNSKKTYTSYIKRSSTICFKSVSVAIILLKVLKRYTNINHERLKTKMIFLKIFCLIVILSCKQSSGREAVIYLIIIIFSFSNNVRVGLDIEVR